MNCTDDADDEHDVRRVHDAAHDHREVVLADCVLPERVLTQREGEERQGRLAAVDGREQLLVVPLPPARPRTDPRRAHGEDDDQDEQHCADDGGPVGEEATRRQTTLADAAICGRQDAPPAVGGFDVGLDGHGHAT
jgi:hypothetical protein